MDDFRLWWEEGIQEQTQSLKSGWVGGGRFKQNENSQLRTVDKIGKFRRKMVCYSNSSRESLV